MKRVILNLFILLAVCLVSCEKVLELEPTSSITAASFWKTENDAMGALNGMYVDLRQVAAFNLFAWGELRSDAMSRALAGTVGYDVYYDNALNTINPGAGWATVYKTVNSANLLIKYAPQIDFLDESLKSSILAQAYTMRAFLYFAMARTWGGVPIRTEPTESYDPLTIQVPRSTVEEVFQLIKSDLDQALALFPTNDFDAGRIKWSKAGASALKADVYLWTGKRLDGGTADFNTALAAIEAVQTADVALLPVYADIFSYDNKGNQEIIMASRFEVLETGHNYFSTMYVTASNNPKNVTPETAEMVGALGVGNNGNSIMQVSDLVRDQFSEDDQRKVGTFFEIYSTEGEFMVAITTKGSGTVDGGTRHFKNDVILYRYADVLLMKAEAKNALGQDPSPEINQVRERAYGEHAADHIFVSGSREQNDEAILKERLLELTTEGKRWWDLVRFGKVFDLVPTLQGRHPETYLLLFPIGTEVRTLEPLVEENPGWE